MSVNAVSPSTGALTKIATRGQYIQYSVMPTASASIVNKIVQYIGTSTASYINGYFYKCEEVSTGVYGWTNISVQAGGSGGGAVDSVNGKTGTVVLDAKDIGLQYDTMPTASATYENQIVQYTGTTDSTYTNGYFYKCVEDGGVYSWVLVADFALASDVYTKTQVGALTDLPDTNKNIVQNIDAINTAVGDKTDKVTSATNGDLAGLDSNGNLTDSGILATNVITKSNTSGLVKNDGTIDESTYLTPVSSATNGDLAGLDANGELTDSGILATNVIVKSNTAGLVKNDGTIDESTYLTSADIADKADVVSGATNGDLAGLDASGNLTDSGILATNVVTKVASATNGDLAGLNASGELTDSGILATNVIVKSNTAGLVKNDGTIDTNTYLTSADIADKADVVDGATVDDFATLDSNGNLADSGINKNIIPSNASSNNQLATKSDVSSIYKPSGNKTVAELISSLLVASNLGNVYNITDGGTTTADFVGGAGNPINVGDNVAIVDVGSSTYKFDLLSGIVDLTNYVQKSQTAGLLKNDGTVNTTIETAVSTNTTDISNIKDGSTIDSFGDVETALAGKQATLTFDNVPTDGSNNPVKSDGIYDAVTANTQLIKDTVGWSGKNEIIYPYYDRNKSINGLTFTMLPNGGVKINGTATDNTAYNFTAYNGTSIVLNGKYKLLGNSEFGASRLKITVEAPAGVNWNNEGNTVIEKEFTNATVQNIRLWMYTGQVFDNVVVYPMLWDAKILDPTFEINYGTTAFPRSEQAVLGARNILPKATGGTDGGLTYTVDDDGKVTIGTGTASANSFLYITRSLKITKTDSYKLTGCPEGGSDTNGYCMQVRDSNNATVLNDIGSGATGILTAGATYTVLIRVANGTAISTAKVFAPMLRLGSDPDSTYSPYAMTNRELTQNKSEVSIATSGTASSTGLRSQKITIDGITTDIDGSAYMEQNVTLSTSGTTTVTFTNAIIADGKTLTLETSLWDLVPDDMVTTTGVCTITLPKWSSATTIGVRLRVR